MQFKSDGTLKIMQITDMQEIPAISPDTLALLDAAGYFDPTHGTKLLTYAPGSGHLHRRPNQGLRRDL